MLLPLLSNLHDWVRLVAVRHSLGTGCGVDVGDEIVAAFVVVDVDIADVDGDAVVVVDGLYADGVELLFGVVDLLDACDIS